MIFSQCTVPLTLLYRNNQVSHVFPYTAKNVPNDQIVPPEVMREYYPCGKYVNPIYFNPCSCDCNNNHEKNKSNNSSKPPSSDGFKKKTKSLRKPTGRKPGGQLREINSTSFEIMRKNKQ